MPRNGNGLFTLVPGVNPVVPNTLIDANWANPTMNDVAQALSASLSSDGQTSPSGNLPMAGFKHTNVGKATAGNEYARADQVQDGSILRCINEINVGNAYSAALPFGPTSFANGQMIVLKFPAENTNTAPTLSINGGVPWPILREDASAIVAGDCRVGVPSRMMWNDSAWLLLGAVVSASSVAGVSSFNTRTGAVVLTSADIQTALTYVPANKAGETFTGSVILKGNAAANLEAVPLQQLLAQIAAIPSVTGVTTWNGRSGAVTLTGTDVVNALTYTPQNTTGPYRLSDGTAAAPAYSWNSENNSGFYRASNGFIALSLLGQLTVGWAGSFMALGAGVYLTWYAPGFASLDTGIRRSAAGELTITDGASNNPRDLKLRTLTPQQIIGSGTNITGGSGTVNVNWLDGMSQALTVTGPVTLTFTNVSTYGNMLRIFVLQANNGTITWPASVIWPGGGPAPSFTTGPLKQAIVALMNWGGSSIYANAAVY
jgi:hypothetical protein